MREVVYPNYSIRFDEGRHRYWLSGLDAENLPVWESVPSVTTILGEICPAPFGAAAWWGQRMGIEGFIRLALTLGATEMPMIQGGEPVEEQAQNFVDLLTKNKLTVNHTRDKAGQRGNAVHYAAQHWAEFGEEIDPLGYPESDMGYVLALKNWLDEANPTVLDVEQMVASKRLGFAGTLDLRAIVDGRMGLIDYKTTSGIRNPSVDYQLAMYELASQECGYPPTDFRAVLRLDESGSWEWYESPTLTSAVEPLLEVWEERKRIEDHVKALKAST